MKGDNPSWFFPFVCLFACLLYCNSEISMLPVYSCREQSRDFDDFQAEHESCCLCFLAQFNVLHS